MLKRMISMVLSICLLLTSMPLQAIAATMPEHEHAYSSELTQEATCTQEGITTYTCSCGEEFTLPIQRREHSFEDGICRSCGMTSPDTAVPEPTEEVCPSTAAQIEWTEEPTCTEYIQATIPATETEIPVQEETVPQKEAVPEETEPEIPETEPPVEQKSTEELHISAEECYATVGDFSYNVITLENGTEAASITGYSGTDADVVIPTELDGYPVVKIGSLAFKDKDTIVSLVIPEGITAIENVANSEYGAFYHCSNLTTVSLPSTLTNIGNYAFYQCPKLTAVTLPKNLDTIGNYAFYGCGAITELTLPAGLTTIGNSAFVSTGITKLELPDSVTSVSLSGLSGQLTYLRWTAGIPVIKSMQFANWDVLETIILPEGVTEIEAVASSSYGAFYHCNKLANVSLPATLTKIGNYAFYQCAALEKITVPGSVETIGNYAFYSCDALTEVTLTAGLKTIGNDTFAKCSALAEISLPNGLETIGSNAFNSTSVAELELPDSVTSLGSLGMENSLTYLRWTAGVPVVPSLAFGNYDMLETVILPEGVTEIVAVASSSYGVFYHCNNLTTVSLPSTLTKIGNYAFYQCPKLTAVTLPENLASIGSYAFYGCGAITELTLPAGLTTIDNSALSGTGITKLELPDSVSSVSLSGLSGQVTYLRWTAGIPVIKSMQFANWDVLETIILPEGVTEIEDVSSSSYGVFYHCNKLTNVSLPTTLTKIGNYAFYQCAALEEITIPGNVETVGSYAFYNCGVLTDVVLSAGVKTIGSYAFANCPAVTELTLPDGLESIEASAFSGTGITRLELPDSVTSVSLYGMSEQLTYLRWSAGVPVVPFTSFHSFSKLETLILPEGVTEIGDGSGSKINGIFYGCSSLTNVSLPSTLKKIGAYAFYNSDTELVSSLVLPEGLETIGDYAFYDCDTWVEPELPAGLTTIGNYAFYSCDLLTSVSLPGNLKTIGKYAFGLCESITEISLPDGLESIGDYAFTRTKITKLELPDSVVTVGSNALQGMDLTYVRWSVGMPVVPAGSFSGLSNLETVILPEGITELADAGSSDMGVFYNCDKLTALDLPGTLTKIGSYAFYGCDSAILENLTIPEKVVSIGNYTFTYCDIIHSITLPGNLETIGDSAFYHCSYLTAISLPDSLKTIGAKAFGFCEGLTELVLPASLTTVGEKAFSNCTSLESVTLPDGLTTLGSSAFYYCTRLTSITLPDSLTTLGDSAFAYCTGLTSITLPDGLTTLASSVFSNCTGLTSITLPDSLTTLGDSAFAYCTGLTRIMLPDSLTTLGSKAFAYCSGLTSITLPDSLTTLGSYAFSNCTGLTSITLPDSLTTLGDSVFYYCSSLENVTLPKRLTSLGNNAFYYCISLTSITLPDSLTMLGNGAFNSCTSLTSITLPDSLITLGSGAFSSCISLTNITLPDSLTTLEDSTFRGCTRLASITLPDGLTKLGANAFDGCSNLTSITLPDDLTTLGSYAFSNCTSLTSITLPDSLTTLGDGVFYYCSSLESVTLPKSLTTLGDAAFYYCSSLASITLPASLTTLGDNAFYYCTGLTSITLPDSLTTLGKYVFAGCTNLTSITLSASLTTLGNSAFNSCTSLTSITLPDSLKTLGSNAFYGCTGLETVKAGSDITSIGTSAFGNCSNVTLFVWPGTMMEDYAIDNGLRYVYYNEYGYDGTLEITLNPTLYQGMQLILQFTDSSISRTITAEKTYSFTGLPVGAGCTVRILNASGEQVLQTEEIIIAEQTRITLEDSASIGSLQVRVLDEQGRDKTAGIDIRWYDETGRPYGAGAQLGGAPVGKVLTCRVQLDASDSRIYRIPEDVVHTVTSGSNVIEISLERIPQIRLTGRITDGNGGIEGASVTVSQKLNGKYDYNTTAVTAHDGAFDLTIPAETAQLAVRANGYSLKELELTGPAADTDLGDITLEAVAGAEVTLELLLTKRAKTGVTAETEKVENLDDLDIAVRNVTKNTLITDLWRQEMTLVLAEAAAAGDELELTVSSLKNQFAAVSVTVTLDKNRKAAAQAELTEYGSMEVSFESTKNETVQLLICGEDGALVTSLTQESSRKTLATEMLEDGTYQVVLMGGSEFFVYPDTLEGLTLAGLAKGTDYLLQTVEVHSGLISPVAFKRVPVLNESQFYYTDAARTIVSASKASLSAGRFFTLRAATAFAEEYQGKVSDIQWVVQLPAGTECYPGTLTVDKQQVAYEQIDNRLMVPVEDPSADLRLCILATGSGKVSPTVSLQFVYDGKTIRQPVGTVTVQIDPFDFEVTGKTFDPSVALVGTGAANTEIQIYDNGILVGQTKSNASGSWTAIVDLHKPGSYSEHKLYAQMNVFTGAKIRSNTHTVTYQYSSEPVSVNTVSMYYNGRLTSVINFKTGEVKGTSYSVAGSANITFMADIDCPDVSLLSDVTLEVTQDDDRVRTMETIYDEQTGTFVASGHFAMRAMPVNVAVSYVYDGELMFSEEHLTDAKRQGAVWGAALERMDTTSAEEWETLFEPIEMDFPEGYEVPEEVQQAVDAYNQAMAEYREQEEVFLALKEELFGNLTASEDKISASGGMIDISFEQVQLKPFSVEDKIAEGYEAFRIGDDKDSLIFVRSTINEQTGLVEQSIIDTTEDRQGLAMYAMGAAMSAVADWEMPMFMPYGGSMYLAAMAADAVSDVKATDVINTLDKIPEEVSNMNSVVSAGGSIATATQDILEKQSAAEWNKYHDLVEKYDKETDAQKKAELSKKATQQSEIASQYEDRLAKNAGKLEKIGKFADCLGPIVDVPNLINDAAKLKNLNNLAAGSDDLDVRIARAQLIARMAVTGLSIVGAVVGIIGTAAVASVSWPFALLALGGTVLSAFWMDNMVNDNYEKAIKKLQKGKDKVKESYVSNDTNGKTNPMKPSIDPSGYIYEAVPSNRLPGVTVTCYEQVTKYDIYDEPYTDVELWDAAEYNQRNPLTTDDMGQYAWDVPQGLWQVKAEKEGYETACSEWLPVPPPQLDVNLGLVSYAVPEIADLFAQPDSVEITFSKYMRAESLTTNTVTVNAGGTPVTGTLELLNAEPQPSETGNTLVSRIRFLPDTALTDGTAVAVSVSDEAVSYADVPVGQKEQAETTVVTIPDSLFAPETVNLAYQGNGIVTIQAKPASLAAGQTVQVSTASELMLTVEETSVVLDENGTAVVHITGKLPGETDLLFAMNEGRIQAKTAVRIQMPVTEDPLNTVDSLEIIQDYVTLNNGQTVSLMSEIQPKKLADQVIWSVEVGGEKIISVDGSGNVTALKAGTAYVIASVSDGEVILTDRCRIDVADAIQLDGIQLSTPKLTAELYSSEYAQFDILLKLPQNYAAAAAMNAEDKPEDLGVAITDAYFADAAMAELFDLVTMDDRTVAVVPTEKALTAGKAVQGKYTGAVTVVVQGEKYTSEPLNLTVKKTLPKLKASMDALNNFYSFHSAQIKISGATVTGISCENLPDWLTLEDGILSLTEMVPAKGGSAKLTLQIETEEWTVPVEAALSVKCSYKTPNIKLSTSSVQFSADAANSTGVQLQLQSKEKNKTLEDLGVTKVSAPAGYSVSGFDAKNGTFILKPESGFQLGKINLEVIFGSTSETMKLPLTVKTTAVSLKLSTKSITLNSGTGDSAAVTVTATPANYQVTAPKLRLEGSDKSDKLNSGELSLTYDNGKLSISTTDLTPDNAKYTLYISATGGKETALKISTTNAEPTLKLKASGNLDLSFPDRKISLTTTFKNHSGGLSRKLIAAGESPIAYKVTETVGKNEPTEKTEAFILTKEGSNLYLSLRDGAELNVKSTYMLYLTLTLEDGSTLPASVKIPVKQTAVNLKLSSNKVTLNNTIADKATIAVTCATKSYEFTKPYWELMDGKGKESAEGKLAVNWVDGKLVTAVNEYTESGTSYKLMVSAAKGAKATALTVTIPAANKSTITGTLKLTGTLDVIRDGTAITVTPTWKNCAEAERTDNLTVLNSNGEDVTANFNITEQNGSYLLSRADGAKLDHSQKYTVTLTTDFGSGITAAATAALKLKMGSAKLTLNAGSTTLFANDRNSRVSISFTSADGTLNKVARAELDPKLQSQFELLDYGYGQYAIGFKNGVVPGKITSANISLNVWLEGNGSAKANASVKVKLSIVR